MTGPRYQVSVDAGRPKPTVARPVVDHIAAILGLIDACLESSAPEGDHVAAGRRGRIEPGDPDGHTFPGDD